MFSHVLLLSPTVYNLHLDGTEIFRQAPWHLTWLFPFSVFDGCFSPSPFFSSKWQQLILHRFICIQEPTFVTQMALKGFASFERSLLASVLQVEMLNSFHLMLAFVVTLIPLRSKTNICNISLNYSICFTYTWTSLNYSLDGKDLLVFIELFTLLIIYFPRNGDFHFIISTQFSNTKFIKI